MRIRYIYKCYFFIFVWYGYGFDFRDKAFLFFFNYFINKLYVRINVVFFNDFYY